MDQRATPTDVYVAAFRARCGRPAIEPPRRRARAGAVGRCHATLVTDDRGCDVLAAVLPDARAGMINVLAAATRCTELVCDLRGCRLDRLACLDATDAGLPVYR